jgi:hypothetical protein
MKHLIYALTAGMLVATPVSAHLFDNMPQEYLKQTLTNLSVCLADDLVAANKLTEIYKTARDQQESTSPILENLETLENSVNAKAKVSQQIIVTLTETYHQAKEDLMNKAREAVEAAVVEAKAKLADASTLDEVNQAFQPLLNHCNDIQKEFIKKFHENEKPLENNP